MSELESRLLETARRRELHHALLLHGPSRDMLRAVAVRMARALNCATASGDDDCTSCQRIDRGIHPDVTVLSPAADRKAISIEMVRELVSGASLRPYEGGVKVFIIDPAEAMSNAAANSLLKTLEEPTRDTQFLLLTRSADLLLPTIKSRCQIVFVRADEEAMVRSASDSSIRAAVLDRLHLFASSRDLGALLGVASVVARKDEVKEAIAAMVVLLRDLAGGTVAEQEREQAETIVRSIPPRALLSAAERALQAIDQLLINADVRLTLEAALVRLARAAR